MNAKFSKRLKAYLLDIILLTLLLAIIISFIPISNKVTKLNDELTMIQDSYLKQEISVSQYFFASADIVKDLDKEQIIYYIVITLGFIGYFVIWPFYHNGQTIGQRKLNIKVVKENNEAITINDLLFRNIIVNYLGYLLIKLLIVLILPGPSYYITSSFISFVQTVIIIMTIIMIIKKQDNHGLHDVLTKTKVIEVEK